SALVNQLGLTKGMPSGYNRDFQECKPPLWNLYARVKPATTLLTRVVNDLKVNNEKIKASITRSNLMALDLAEYACQAKGIPFRKAHELVGKIVNYLAKQGKNLADKLSASELTVLETISKETLGKNIMDDGNFVTMMKKTDWHEERRSQGSPSMQSMENMLLSLDQKANSLQKRLNNELMNIEKATSKFLKNVKDIIEI
nr:hypothetical protein [Candidatus Sigynarchaeota archaeon]